MITYTIISLREEKIKKKNTKLVALHTDEVNLKNRMATNFERESLLDCYIYINVTYNQNICPILSTRKSKKRISKVAITFDQQLGQYRFYWN